MASMLVRLLAVTFTVAALSGCAAASLHRDGMKLIRDGDFEAGVSKLSAAVELAPTNAVYRTDYIDQRDLELNRLIEEGKSATAAEQWQVAATALARAHALSPKDPRPQDATELLTRAKGAAGQLEQAKSALRHDDVESAANLVSTVLVADPKNPKAIALMGELDARRGREQSDHPVLKSLKGRAVSLSFENASVKMILESIGRLSGIAVVLDQDVKPDLTASITVSDVPPEDAVAFVTQTAHLRSKTLDSHTVFVYPATADKIRDYEDLIVKAFYLSDGDVRRVEGLLKAFLKTDETFVDEKQNLLIVRGSAETLRLAEKLVAMDDVTQPEVMLEVQVMEVSRSRLNNLGVQYPNQATLGIQPSSGSSTSLLDYKKINPSVISLVIPNTVVNLSQVFTDADLLANPRIRVKNREHAKILIGDKLPVVTSTATSTGFVSENIQYLDVGLKLDVAPDISVDERVSINMSLEVSSVVNQITTPGGSLAYDIGTRDASSVLELKDGETEVLAGLISDNDTRTATNIPGLGQFPLVGRLFSNHKTDHEKSEIVLLITPHIVRGYRPSLATGNQFWSGTASRLQTEPLILHHTASKSAAGGEAPAPAPAAPTNGLSVPAIPPGAVLSWKGPLTVKIGETFNLSLHAKAASALHGLPFIVRFDTNALEVLQVREGPYFKGSGNSTLFASSVDADSGKVVVSAGASGNTAVAGDNDLVTLVLRAKAVTTAAAISIDEARPVDAGGGEVALQGPPEFDVVVNNPK